MFDRVILVLVIISVLISVVVLIMAVLKKEAPKNNVSKNDLKDLKGEIDKAFTNSETRIANALNIQLGQQATYQKDSIETLTKNVNQRLEDFRQALKDLSDTTEKKLSQMMELNDQKLDKINDTVSEKLDKTLNERLNNSFNMISENLQKVQSAVGEMKAVGDDVSDLKKVLSNVKTRGIFGEVQLAALLEQILTKEQYDMDIITKPKSKDRVEFAIKYPGYAGETVYMPIDSKFPLDTYQQLQDALETCDASKIEAARKQFKQTIKNEAKDISEKYLQPPFTTEFGVMFLPTEGLYAEVVQSGLADEIRTTYKIIASGPTTMAALLNSLQMGFKTIAIQEKTTIVWKVLNNVKTEFDKFEAELTKASSQLETVSTTINNLRTTRTNQMQRKLKEIETYNGQIEELEEKTED